MNPSAGNTVHFESQLRVQIVQVTIIIEDYGCLKVLVETLGENAGGFVAELASGYCVLFRKKR